MVAGPKEGTQSLLEVTAETDRKEAKPTISPLPLSSRTLPVPTTAQPNCRPEGKVSTFVCDKNRAREGQAMNLRAKKELTHSPSLCALISI